MRSSLIVVGLVVLIGVACGSETNENDYTGESRGFQDSWIVRKIRARFQDTKERLGNIASYSPGSSTYSKSGGGYSWSDFKSKLSSWGSALKSKGGNALSAAYSKGHTPNPVSSAYSQSGIPAFHNLKSKLNWWGSNLKSKLSRTRNRPRISLKKDFLTGLKHVVSGVNNIVANSVSYDSIQSRQGAPNLGLVGILVGIAVNAIMGANNIGTATTTVTSVTITDSTTTTTTTTSTVYRTLVTSGLVDHTTPTFSVVSDVLDLVSTGTCSAQTDYPASVSGAVGGLLDSATPLVCGGSTSNSATATGMTTTCYNVATGATTGTMHYSRYLADSAVVTSTSGSTTTDYLFVTGGYSFTTTYQPTAYTEYIDSAGTYTDGPILPYPTAHHCMVMLDSTTVMIIGGDTGDAQADYSKLTWTNTYGSSVWYPGPDLTAGRNGANCGVISTTSGARYVVVSGGIGTGAAYLSSTELLPISSFAYQTTSAGKTCTNTDGAQVTQVCTDTAVTAVTGSAWIAGPSLVNSGGTATALADGAMVAQSTTELTLIGGATASGTEVSTIQTLTCTGEDTSTCSWTQSTEDSQSVARDKQVAMLLPESLSTCTYPG